MTSRRNSISIWKKKEVIDWINTTGEGVPSRAAAHFRSLGWNFDPATARRWWRQREEIWAAKPTQMRVAGGGRKRALGALEDLLLETIVLRRLKKEKVTREWIAAQALQLYSEVSEDQVRLIEASPHWVSEFMKRNDLSLRRRTNLTTLTDEQLIGRAVSYMRYLSENKGTFNFRHTILMDETAVYFEDAREQTVEVRGARHVVVKSTGFSSMRVTAVLAVTATGVKLPPLVIWKHKKGSRTIQKVGGVRVAYQPKAWVDSELLCNWIDMVFPKVLQAEGKTIVWDSMRAHISRVVKAKCKDRNIAMCVIPGGLTAYLQAGDIGIYKQFKDILYNYIDEWKNSGAVEYTRAGNPRPPSAEVACQWVRKAWKDTDQETIDNSVAAAGFSPIESEWFIWRHDVYGRGFQREWENEEEKKEENTDSDVDDELANALDDVELVDE